MSATTPTAILLIHCADQRGINAQVTQFVAFHNGNIVDFDQHVDQEQGIFFMRIEWELEGFRIPRDHIALHFEPLAQSFDMTWELKYSDRRPRMAIFVSKQSHCLYDILARRQAGEWDVDIPLIIGNHPDLEPVARSFGIDFRLFPITRETKREQEMRELELLEEERIDCCVLARYMQILSEAFVEALPHRVINIHHSFLPAFVGAKPYHAAFARGVKLIGATSHYVTSELDEGPILAQETMRVTHKDSVDDLVRKGKDLEKIVLARAIWDHLRHKVLVYGNKTVIFD